MVALAERLGFTLPGNWCGDSGDAVMGIEFIRVIQKGDVIGIAVVMLLVTIGLSVGCYQAVVALKKQYGDNHTGERISGGNNEQ